MIDHLINSAVRSLVEEKKEKKDKPKAKITAKPGRGRVKSYISAARARAQSDPGKLLQSLGITEQFKARLSRVQTFDDQIVTILRQALMTHPAMQAAFVGIKKQYADPRAIITLDKLEPRDGVMFINHIIVAAQNANLVELKKDINVVKSSDRIIVSFIPLQ